MLTALVVFSANAQDEGFIYGKDDLLIPDKNKAPEEYATKAIKKNLKLLVKESKALHKMIQKNASDAEIKAALFKLHDRFHTIAEICNHQNGEEH